MVHRREQILGFMREFGISSVDSRARSLRLREVARIAKVFEIKRRA